MKLYPARFNVPVTVIGLAKVGELVAVMIADPLIKSAAAGVPTIVGIG